MLPVTLQFQTQGVCWQDDRVDQGTCCQSYWVEFDPTQWKERQVVLGPTYMQYDTCKTHTLNGKIYMYMFVFFFYFQCLCVIWVFVCARSVPNSWTISLAPRKILKQASQQHTKARMGCSPRPLSSVQVGHASSIPDSFPEAGGTGFSEHHSVVRQLCCSMDSFVHTDVACAVSHASQALTFPHQGLDENHLRGA